MTKPSRETSLKTHFSTCQRASAQRPKNARRMALSLDFWRSALENARGMRLSLDFWRSALASLTTLCI